MGTEKFCLRWNDFESNISSAFRELRDDKDFFDITLACEDEQIQAHKLILSACSPFFRNILRRNIHQHPLLYLKGVKYTDLQSVLNFMYHGEVNVAQEELNSFLAVAEDLRVKGLTQNNSQTSNPGKENSPAIKKQQQSKPTHRPPDREGFQVPKRSLQPPPIIDNDEIQEIIPVKSEPSDILPPPPTIHHPSPSLLPTQSDTSYTHSTSQALAHTDDQGMSMAYQEDENYDDYGQYETGQEYTGNMGMDIANKDIFSQLDALISTMMYKSEKAWHCTVCEKSSPGKINITRHIEATHLENHPGLDCDVCGETVKSRNALRLHRAAKHRGISC